MIRNLLQLIIACLICFPIDILAQSSSKFSVIIIDASDNSPLPLATVRLKSPTGDFFGSITDMNGVVEFPSVKQGTYDVNVTYIGYEDQTKRIVIDKASRIELFM